MTAYNVVRMRVKPGHVEDYIKFHKERAMDDFGGMNRFTVIQTGERDFCLIGEWTGMDALVAARPAMIATLDEFRDQLEDLGSELGVTDPVSGEAVIERHA